MAVLARLGVLDAIMTDAVRPRRTVSMDAVTGKEIAAIDLGRRFVEPYGYPDVGTPRADLDGGLLAGCREPRSVTLAAGSALVYVERRADGRIRVCCADGSVYLASALLGADGVRSTIRAQVVVDDPVPSEYVAYRGTVPIEAVGQQAVESPTVLSWLGPS